jgi:hypothetical protein
MFVLCLICAVGLIMALLSMSVMVFAVVFAAIIFAVLASFMLFGSIWYPYSVFIVDAVLVVVTAFLFFQKKR